MFVALAPMEGVVDAIMRDLLTSVGGIDQCTTEFVRVTDREIPDHVFHKYCPELLSGGKTPSGVPVYVQLLGGKPEWLAVNALRAYELGAPGIDLNFGCPAKTVNRHDGGATLLKNPHRLFDVVFAVRQAVPPECPVTAKVRLGFADKTLAIEIAQAVDQAEASRLTIHARTRAEGYQPPAHWEYIGLMREAVQVPVVANGDIWNAKDYDLCVRASGCPDVALGRPLIAFPDLARVLKAHLFNEPYTPLHWSDIQDRLLIPFLDRCSRGRHSGFALNRGKQWLRQLARQYSSAQSVFERAKRVNSLEDFRQILLANSTDQLS
ncbi:MAG: tRNA-dihydrouridine synthase [Bdellovibrionaceae bacterium]|nr:tRNA-dihydrouridine synthase [Bdellovibrionales bacterium]MCB9083121.1 tRNA-dihydrouridine synthase [Pseudobdellovibrionaceae bacterium]